jgi:hypothetical protein
VAIRANDDFLANGYFFVTSNFVLDETFSLLRYDAGHKRAIEFGHEIKYLETIRKIQVCYINQSLMYNAFDLFEKYSDKDFSFTDCTSFILMEKLNINEAFSFDKHFEQYKFIRLPII